MQASSKPAIELPNGYGELVETMVVKDVPDLEGTLFVHARDAGKPGHVASLRLKSGGQQVSFKHLWEPKSETRSRAGSLLLFRNAPNSTRGETWTSVDYRRRRVEVYEGPNGPFAVIPNGEPADDGRNDPRVVVPLSRREANAPRPGFNAGAFQSLASSMKAAVQGNSPAPAAPAPAKVSTDEADVNAVLAVLKELDVGQGARWDDVLKAAQGFGLGAEATEAVIGVLMCRGKAFEPTLGILKAT